MSQRKYLKNAFEIVSKENPKCIELFEQLMEPHTKLELNFFCKMKEKMVSFKGFRVQHNNILGPYKGGLRFHPKVNMNHCEDLAYWMTMKCALQNIEFGGGKGGIQFNPNDYSENEIMDISGAFARALAPFIHERDVPAPDVGSNSKIMDHMLEQHNIVINSDNKHQYTGKSVGMGGSEGRTEATGFGIAECIRTYYNNDSVLRYKTFVLQGFGNVGYHTALSLHNSGLEMVAVGDITGTIMNPNGIDPFKLYEYIQKHKTVRGFEDCVEIEDLFSVPCDVLIPAALGNVITKYNVDTLNCNLVVEGANGPVTQEASALLEEKKIDVIPDILANSGGVLCSYFEYVQNKNNETWTKEEVVDKLYKKMNLVFKNVQNTSKKYNVSLKQAAYIEAFQNLYNKYNNDP